MASVLEAADLMGGEWQDPFLKLLLSDNQAHDAAAWEPWQQPGALHQVQVQQMDSLDPTIGSLDAEELPDLQATISSGTCSPKRGLQCQAAAAAGRARSAKESGSSSSKKGRPRGGGDNKVAGSTMPKTSRKFTTQAQREAHKRYREKKKQSIADLELEVQLKRQQLEALRAENEQLQSRERVLETAKRCSMEIHELMQMLEGMESLSVEEEEGLEAACAGGGLSSTSLDSPLAPLHGRGHVQAAAPSGPQGSGASLAAAAAAAARAQGTHQQPQHPQQRVSMQTDEHWMQLAEQYVSGAAGFAPPPPQQQQQQQQQQQHAAPIVPPTLQHVPSRSCSNASRSSSGDCSSTLLTEVGSVETAEQGLVVYVGFLQHAATMLQQAQAQQEAGDAAGASDTRARLAELTRTTIARLQPFLVARGQGVVYDWSARNLATHEPEEPPASLWPRVLDGLGLSPDTQRDALQCFELFGAPLSRLLEEREVLTARYRALQRRRPADAAAAAAAAAAGDPTSGSNDGGGGGGAGAAVPSEAAGAAAGGGGEDIVSIFTARTIESVGDVLIDSACVLKAIAANLERYQSLDGVFAHSLTNLLTGDQIAAACVASYPYLPRWHSMMVCLQQRKQEVAAAAQAAAQQHRRSTRQRVPSRVRQSTLYG